MRTGAPSPVSRTLAWISTLAALAFCGCSAGVSGSVNNRVGSAWYKRGNYTAARYAFNRAVIDNPRNPDYAYNMAAVAHKQGDFAEAERFYRHAMHLNPAHQPAHHGMAEMLVQQNRHGEALESMHAWVNTQPYEPAAHVEMASLQQKLGNHVAAEQSLQTALRTKPDHSVALAKLGEVYQQTGRQQHAVAMYQRSLAKKWNQPQVHARMAELKTGRPTSRSTATSATRLASNTPFFGNRTAAVRPVSGMMGTPAAAGGTGGVISELAPFVAGGVISTPTVVAAPTYSPAPQTAQVIATQYVSAPYIPTAAPAPATAVAPRTTVEFQTPPSPEPDQPGAVAPNFTPTGAPAGAAPTTIPAEPVDPSRVVDNSSVPVRLIVPASGFVAPIPANAANADFSSEQ